MNEWADLDYLQGEWKISKFMDSTPPPLPPIEKERRKERKESQTKLGQYSLESQG